MILDRNLAYAVQNYNKIHYHRKMKILFYTLLTIVIMNIINLTSLYYGYINNVSNNIFLSCIILYLISYILVCVLYYKISKYYKWKYIANMCLFFKLLNIKPPSIDEYTDFELFIIYLKDSSIEDISYDDSLQIELEYY